jgi:hypothetical protein
MRRIQLHHHGRIRVAVFQHVEYRRNIYFALSERTVARIILSAVIVFQVDVADQRQKVLHNLDRIRSAFRQLPDIRAEFHVLRIHGIQNRINLIARFDAGAGMLVQGRSAAHIHQHFRPFVQHGDDVRLAGFEIVAGSRNTFGPSTQTWPPYFFSNPPSAPSCPFPLCASSGR